MLVGVGVIGQHPVAATLKLNQSANGVKVPLLALMSYYSALAFLALFPNGQSPTYNILIPIL